ncbi:MAG: hypothetical protein H8E55_68865 [Pelagibacterales bacterium]|nr:hypothetical protein [Pelagibacterales bacterium]
MYYLIESQQQLDNIDLIKGPTFLEFIYGNDNIHPALAEVIAIYIKPQDDKGYIIPINHPEAINWDKDVVFNWLEQGEFLIKDKKAALHINPKLKYTDIQSINYYHTNQSLSDTHNTQAHAWYYRKFPQIKVNKIIPLGKHYERYNTQQLELSQVISEYNNNPYTLYNDKILPILYKLEQQTLKINGKFDDFFELKCKKHSIKENQIYGQYNPYTTTGRPVNNFNGLNFMGMNHKTGERSCFKPRNTCFIEMDYNGYHPRLIGEMVGFSFGKESVHETLAKMYFDTNKISDEQYKEGKTLTFQQIYGGIDEKYLKHEFFKKVQEYVDLNWELFNTQDYIGTEEGRKIWKKNHPNINKQRLFNYLIQAYETETNIIVMKKLQEYLKEKKTNLVMYVYDAFIFDVAKEDGKDIIQDLQNIVSEKFPIDLKAGLDYGDLT